jgi:hypothetical protein
VVKRKPKALAKAPPSALGQPTIMDRALAAKHGVTYVHLAALAIDLDRLAQDPLASAALGETPGWEVYLVERHLLDRMPLPELLEDIVIAILEGRKDALGGQMAFAIWDGMRRGLPERLRFAFGGWRGQADDLAADLDPLFDAAPDPRPGLARRVLAADLDPPLAPPVKALLTDWALENEDA